MHCSTAGGPHRALERCVACGGESAQIFVKNNMQWFGRPYSAEALRQYRQQREVAGLKVIFGHTGYLINIAGPESANRRRSIRSLVQEIELAEQLEIPFLVLHPGAHLGAGEAVGLRQASRALDEVCAATRRSKVRIALENTAGQGTCLGAAIDHLAELYRSVRAPERLGICLDTAHLLAAGYDIRTRRGWNAVIREVQERIGLDQILAFHLNDSKGDLGSRVDRHAGIGQGRIGRKGFRHIVGDRRFRNHSGCLETPKSPDLHEDVENLKILRSLARPRRRSSPKRSPRTGC